MSLYAVRAGHTTGIFKSWPECQKQILNYKGAEYRKFGNVVDAENFMKRIEPEPLSDIRHSHYNAEYNYSPHLWNKYENEYYIFTDGSAKGSAKSKVLRFAIFLGFAELNISELTNEATNNRCELLAIQRTLEILNRTAPDLTANILSDSEYSVKSCNIWISKWKRNSWKTANNTDVANRDIMEKLDQLMGELKHKHIKFTIQHIRSHESAPSNPKDFFMWRGNYIADQLAQDLI